MTTEVVPKQQAPVEAAAAKAAQEAAAAAAEAKAEAAAKAAEAEAAAKAAVEAEAHKPSDVGAVRVGCYTEEAGGREDPGGLFKGAFF